MGLYVHSLAELPIEAKRSYYIYLLDYGWKEPLGEALKENFERMALLASQNDAIVIRGANSRVHFYDEVFSYHSINGEKGEELLPAILLTNRHPKDFKESFGEEKITNNRNFKIVLFPLKKYCKTTTDVANYVDGIFRDIIERKDLSDFSIQREMKPSFGRAIVSGFILQPNWNGVGYDFNKLIDYFKSK